MIIMKSQKHKWVELRWSAFGEVEWCMVGYNVLKQGSREEQDVEGRVKVVVAIGKVGVYEGEVRDGVQQDGFE